MIWNSKKSIFQKNVDVSTIKELPTGGITTIYGKHIDVEYHVVCPHCKNMVTLTAYDVERKSETGSILQHTEFNEKYCPFCGKKLIKEYKK